MQKLQDILHTLFKSCCLHLKGTQLATQLKEIGDSETRVGKYILIIYILTDIYTA